MASMMSRPLQTLLTSKVGSSCVCSSVIQSNDRGNDAWKYKFIVSDSRFGSQDGSRVQSFGSREEEVRIVEAFEEEEHFVSDTSDLEVLHHLISHFLIGIVVWGLLGPQISKVWGSGIQ